MLGLLKHPLVPLGGFTPVRNVAQEADEQPLAELLAGGDRQLDRDFAPVAAQRGDFDALVEHRALTRRKEVVAPRLVRPAQRLRHDQLAQLLADRFVGAPAEGLLGDRIPAGDPAILGHHHDRIEGGVEDGLKSSVQGPPGDVHFGCIAYFMTIFQ
jgi:hypothetical protein